ncbi:nitroreductase family protein [Enterococcus asini]|uniref:nitroreductase family protein n=1 Tax=Enterococcus asini TaxID=57732 RepID=UPI00241FE84C|nr:nitroreductase family protein [Enterococcus asini]
MKMSSLKSSVKRTLGPKNVAYLKYKVSKFNLSKEYNWDKKKYYSNFSNVFSSDEHQLGAKITFNAHQLEKGLSHKNFRVGFGKNPLTQLSKNMQEYISRGYSKENKVYINALSCLRAYIEKHEELGEPLPEHYTKNFNFIKKEILECTSKIGGFDVVNINQKINNRVKDYKTLFENRVAIREYADEQVDISKIKEAITISMKTPSVCNRQSSRIRVITDKKLIEQSLKIQAGFNGYKLPPCLLLITTDTSAFIETKERNQVYIDGGLFSMSILNALEYVGLAACPLHTMFNVKDEVSTRKVLDVPENENLIMYIAVGNFNQENLYCKSFRNDAESITTFL